MGLEHELLELNGAYQNTVATNLDLQERIQELEQLAREYQAMMAEIIVHVPVGAKRIGRIDTLIQRANALLS